MPRFGAFQTDRLLLRSGRESFWVARDAANSVCTLHVLEPPEVWTDEQKADAINAFLARARFQQDVAKETNALAPVLSLGSDEHHAFVSYERCDESLARLISSRPQLSTPALRRFVAHMLDALGTLKKAGHPHGALSAESLLLTSTRFQVAKPFLVCPNPDAPPDHDDMPALGRILYRLIQHKEYSDRTGIGTDDTWRALPEGDAWKHLIVSLLAPDHDLTHDAVRKSVPKPSVHRGKTAYVAAALALAIAIAGSAYYFSHPAKPADDTAWLAATTQSASEAASASGPPIALLDTDPAAPLWKAIKSLSEQKNPRSTRGAQAVKQTLTTLPAALETIDSQIGDFKTAFAALPNKGDYPNFIKLLDTLQTRLAELKKMPQTDPYYFERAAQFAALSNALSVLQRQLEVPDSPVAIHEAFYIVIDHVVPDAQTGSLKQLLANIRQQPFIKSEDIAHKKPTIAWDTIPKQDYPPTWDGLEKLQGNLLTYSKVDPTIVIQQANGMVADIETKQKALTAKMESLTPDLKKQSEGLKNDYAAVADKLTSRFISPPSTAGGAFDPSRHLFWISRDLPAIQAEINAQKTRLNTCDVTYDALFGLNLKKWIVDFAAAGKLNRSFYAYYDETIKKYPGDTALLGKQIEWKQGFQSAFDEVSSNYGSAQGSLKSLSGQLPQNPAGLEKAVADILTRKLAAIRGRLDALSTTFDPANLSAARADLNTFETQLGGMVSVRTVAANISAPTLDPVAISKNVEDLKLLESDPDLQPILAPVHAFSDGISNAAAAKDAASFATAMAQITNARISGVAPLPDAIQKFLWSRFSELKTENQDLLKYELTQVPPADRASPTTLETFISTRLPSDAQPNLLMEAFIPAALKANDSKTTDAVASELSKLNAATPAPRLTHIIASLKVDPNATVVVGGGPPGLLQHGWQEAAIAADGTRTFIFPRAPAGKSLQLQFKKLDNTQTFLCTTEAPLLLLAAFSDTQRPALRARVDFTQLDNVEVKPGLKITINGIVGFQRDDDIAGTDWGTWTTPSDTVKGWAAPSAPTLDQPLQFVTPALAAYIAIKSGCRLPTAQEWLAADKMNKAAVATYDSAANLSGPAWDAYRRQYQTEFVDQGATTSTLGNPINITNASFDPTTKPAAWGTMANPNKPWPSKVLGGKPRVDEVLFRPVGTGSAVPFINLIGNVAEYAFDAPLTKALSGLTVADDPATGVDAVAAAIRAAPASVKVIGGSALMPLGSLDNARIPLDVPDVTKPYTDVGFRLAFDAGSSTTKPIADQIADNLKASPLPANDLFRAMVKP